MADEVLVVLEQAREAGLTVRVDGSDLQVDGEGEPTRQAWAAIESLKEYKAEVVSYLKKYGDGQPPPLDRPPVTEQELRRLIDHLADPAAFAEWLDWAMNNPDDNGTDRILRQ